MAINGLAKYKMYTDMNTSAANCNKNNQSDPMLRAILATRIDAIVENRIDRMDSAVRNIPVKLE